MRSSITISLVEQARGGPFVYWDGVDLGTEGAAGLGFDAVEVFPVDADQFVKSNVGALAADRGLAIAAVGTGAGWVVHRYSLADESAEIRRRAIAFIQRILEVASAWNAPAIIGSMQGRSGERVPKETARQYLREGLEILDAYAESIGGRILYEPLNRYETDQCNTMAQGVALVQGLKCTRLLADWFHMNIEETDMAAALREAADWIGHIHFADTNRRAIGMGHLEVPPLVEALRAIGYQGYLSAEVIPLPSSDAAARATIEAFHRYVRNDGPA